MRKSLLLAILLTVACVAGQVHALETHYANDSYASQLSMDAFNKTVKHRMEVARFAFYGGVQTPPAQNYVAGNIADCPMSMVTVWADGYETWAKKKDSNGYRYNVGGPALGIDWSNGPFTAGIAATHSWGKMKGRQLNQENKTRMWAFTGYAQWNYERFYVNTAVTYGRNRMKHTRYDIAGVATPEDPGRARYHTNAWNAQMEMGTRLNICNFLIEPNVGVRYFHDHRSSFTERFLDPADNNQFSKRNYRTWEVPIGVNVGYEIAAFNTMIIPRLHAAYVPQFDRKSSTAESAAVGAVGPVYERSKRSKHGWELGAGIQTKVFRSVSAHVDYSVNMRSKTYEHTLTAGLGMSF